jgi:hypothetical protein
MAPSATRTCVPMEGFGGLPTSVEGWDEPVLRTRHQVKEVFRCGTARDAEVRGRAETCGRHVGGRPRCRTTSWGGVVGASDGDREVHG